MEVIFSRYAKRQMKWRDISEEEVKLALTDFDKIEDSIKGRKAVYKQFPTRVIKVTFIEKKGKIIVITAVIR